jgi:hypothetical protein
MSSERAVVPMARRGSKPAKRINARSPSAVVGDRVTAMATPGALLAMVTQGAPLATATWGAFPETAMEIWAELPLVMAMGIWAELPLVMAMETAPASTILALRSAATAGWRKARLVTMVGWSQVTAATKAA